LSGPRKKSDRQVAETVDVSHVTVGKVRHKMESTGHSDRLEKRIGKDGKARTTTPARRGPGAGALTRAVSIAARNLEAVAKQVEHFKAKERERQIDLEEVLPKPEPTSTIVSIPRQTEGPVTTITAETLERQRAREIIDFLARIGDRTQTDPRLVKKHLHRGNNRLRALVDMGLDYIATVKPEPNKLTLAQALRAAHDIGANKHPFLINAIEREKIDLDDRKWKALVQWLAPARGQPKLIAVLKKNRRANETPPKRKMPPKKTARKSEDSEVVSAHMQGQEALRLFQGRFFRPLPDPCPRCLDKFTSEDAAEEDGAKPDDGEVKKRTAK
jgi:hypothetical protein